MKRQCRCSSRQIEQYHQRISGPLLDRIDLHIEVPLVDFRELSNDTVTGGKSETVRARVVEARRIKHGRFRKAKNRTNSAMGPRQMREHCKLDNESRGYLEHAMEEMNFSARARDRPAAAIEDSAGRPSRWKPVRDPNLRGIWFIRYRHHLVFSRQLHGGCVGVISVLHESMDIPRRLEEDADDF